MGDAHDHSFGHEDYDPNWQGHETELNNRQRTKVDKMAGYDPNAHTPTKGQADYDTREIPAGVYLLGPTWLQCPTALSWKVRFGVLMGSFKDASCFVMQGRDTNKQGTKNRLYYYCKSAGVTAELEVNNDGVLTERSIRADLLGHVIKAKVTKERKGEYTNYDFMKFQDRGEWSQAELDIAVKWEAEFAAKRDAENDGDDYGGSAGWGGDSGGSSGSDSQGGGGDDPGPSGDEWGNDGW